MKKYSILLLIILFNINLFAKIKKTLETDSSYIIYHVNEQGIKNGSCEVYDNGWSEVLIEKGEFINGKKDGIWEYYSKFDWNIYIFIN